MLCQNCQKRVANVHFTQVINNKKTEMYLCEKCAREKGQFSLGSPISISDFFSGLIGVENSLPYNSSASREVACDKCGMTFEEFQKTGKLGCANCYEVLGERLRPIIRRLHGADEHTGKVPSRLSKGMKTSREIEMLKDQLNKAIQNEEYEEAAQIRDEIKGLEAGK